MKFLQEPVEQEVVSVLTDIQALFSDMVTALIDVKSNSMQKYLQSIENVPKMSLTELESLVAGKNKEFIGTIVKNGTRHYSFFESKYKYGKQKAITAKEVAIKSAFYGMMPKISAEKFEEKNDDYEELVAIYSDANNIANKKVLKTNVLVAIVDYVLTNLFYITYNQQKCNQNNYLINRCAGLVILDKNSVFLNNINEVFKKDFVIPNVEQENKPSDNYKTLNAKVLVEDDFVSTNSLNFSEVQFISWEKAFANKNVATKYLTSLNDNYLFVDTKNKVYLVKKNVKLIPVNLTNYINVKKDLFNEKEYSLNYSNVLNCVMKNMFKKPELFKQYSFFENGDSVGMFEEMEVSLTGTVSLKTIEMVMDKYGNLDLKYFSYSVDVNKLVDFKPASELKLTLFLVMCERIARNLADYSLKDMIS